MKILITGSSGMVGKNIISHVNTKKYEILSPTSKELNLLDVENIESYISFNQPDFIIHSAGIVGGIQANISNPVKFLYENMQMGLNIVTTAKYLKVKKFMNLGSSCMYPRDIPNPLAESMISKGELEPTNEGYAIAKVAITKLCQYISREDKSYLYKTVIPCNLYGKYDKFDPIHSHMIPGVMLKIYKAKSCNRNSVEIWGDGLSRREFMYAEDFADFVFYAITNFEKMPQDINVGMGHDYSINEYYKEIANVTGFKGNFTHDLEKPTGMKQKLIDNTKLKNFGWKYKTTLKEGLQMTYEYFLNEINHD